MYFGAHLSLLFYMDSFLGSDLGNTGLPMDILNASIISSNFWPPIQVVNHVPYYEYIISSNPDLYFHIGMLMFVSNFFQAPKFRAIAELILFKTPLCCNNLVALLHTVCILTTKMHSFFVP